MGQTTLIDGKYEYFAFISYKDEGKDAEIAKWLQHKLEHYKLPIAVRKERPELPERISPIYEYKSEAGSGRLKDVLWQGLTSSKYLIIICSPRATRSEWLNKGIRHFVENGLEENIIPFIIEGKPKAADTDEECFPSELLKLKGDRELRGININDVNKDFAAITVIARMLGVKVNTLWKRYEREQKKKRLMWTLSGIAALIVSFIIIGLFSFQNIMLRQANWKMKENQYRAIAAKAVDLAQGGDSYSARLLSTEILMNYFTNNGPFCPEAEYALRYSDRLQSHIMRGHSNKVTSAAISLDEKYIASSSWDGYVNIWNVSDGKLVKSLNAEKHKVFDVAFSPDCKHIACGYYDGTVRIWNYIDGSVERDMDGHLLFVKSVSYSNNGKMLVSAGFDKNAIIWDVNTGGIVHKLSCETGGFGGVNKASFSPDDKLVATASADSIIRLWDVKTGNELKKLLGHSGYVNDIRFNSHGNKLISAGEDGTIRVWDLNTGKEIEKILGHDRMINSASFSHDEKQIVSASNDNTIRVFDANTGLELYKFTGHKDFVQTACFILNDANILSSSYDGTARVWDINDFKESRILSGDYHYASFSPDGKYIVSAGENHEVDLWDVKKQIKIRSMKGHDNRVYCSAFSPDGGNIISSSYDGSIIIWETKTGKLLHKINGHTQPVTKAFYNPNGKTIASASWDGTIKIWETSNFHELRKISAHNGYIISISYSPDGNFIASASADSTACIWDLNSGKQIIKLDGHKGAVLSVSYSPNGRNILTASKDRFVRMWDSNTGKELLKIELPNEVYCVSYSTDGEYFLATSYDGIIHVFNADSGVEVEKLNWETTGYSKSAYTSFFSPNGNMIITSCTDYYLRLWEFKPLKKLLDDNRKKLLGISLTHEERRKYYLE